MKIILTIREKTGPSVRKRLVKIRYPAAGHVIGQTSLRNSRNGKCCEMLAELLHFSVNGL